jgi:uncharacterized protein (TIGR02246 family)
MPNQNEERELVALFESADRALERADLHALAKLFADDWVQYDPKGRSRTKAEVFANLERGTVRYPSIRSTSRDVRIFGDMAVVHGSETDEVESEGHRTTERYLYLDVLQKREGQWRIVSSLLAKPAS